jgi:hypothetical protein
MSGWPKPLADPGSEIRLSGTAPIPFLPRSALHTIPVLARTPWFHGINSLLNDDEKA